MTAETMKELAAWAEPIESAALVVIGMHGRGQDIDFVKNLTDRLNVRGVAYVAPAAPDNSWYPHPFLEQSVENATALEGALNAVEESIQTVRKKGARRVALLGFSQGSCVLAHFLLTRSAVIDGTVLYTGGYVGYEPLDHDVIKQYTPTPVLLRSVDRDPWVPPHRVADTARLLSLGGSNVDVLIEKGDEHVVTEKGIADGRAFLTSLTHA